MPRPKQRRWRLDEAEVEFNAILAKLRMKFKKEGIAEETIREMVQQEFERVASREEETPNVFAETIAQIARRERNRAVRDDRYVDALAAGAVEYFANKSVNPSQKKRKRRSLS